MRRSIRGESASGGELKTSGRTLRKGSWASPDGDAAFDENGTDLVHVRSDVR